MAGTSSPEQGGKQDMARRGKPRPAREQVLEGLRALTKQNWRRLKTELQTYAALRGRASVRLADFLHDQALELEDWSWPCSPPWPCGLTRRRPRQLTAAASCPQASVHGIRWRERLLKIACVTMQSSDLLTIPTCASRPCGRLLPHSAR